VARTHSGTVTASAICTEILKSEESYKSVGFGSEPLARDWATAISSLSSRHNFAIVEAERLKEPDFMLGRITKTKAKSVLVQGISGVGHWHEEPTKFKMADITSFQVGGSYISAYERNV